MARHLEELMANGELYGWEPVRVYLQQVENGQVKWSDTEAKLQFCHALV